jgi:hypothetical protein
LFRVLHQAAACFRYAFTGACKYEEVNTAIKSQQIGLFFSLIGVLFMRVIGWQVAIVR